MVYGCIMSARDDTDPLPGPALLSVGGVFIDDIVFPDGRTEMGVLGGAATHAATGMRLWGERPALVACLGQGFPQPAAARLEAAFDLRGIVRLEIPQARSWQLFEPDGRRTEVFRVEFVQPFVNDPQPAQVPPALRAARGVYLLRFGADVPGWRAHFPDTCLLWEPQQIYMTAANRAEFRRLLPLVDVVSPNVAEARAVYGFDDPERLARTMVEDGARIAALRMGPAGSLVAAHGRDHVLSVPALPVPHVADQTGAGNTYCGAFLAGWLQTGDLRTAAAYGAVAASFALEVIGVADVDAPGALERRDQRLRWVLERMLG